MPLENPVHKTTTRMLDESYLAEFDHDNNWLAVIAVPNNHLNFAPPTAQKLLDFLNEMADSLEQRASRPLSDAYHVTYNYGLLTLEHLQHVIISAEAMRPPRYTAFSVEATQKLRLFLDEMLTKSQQEMR